MLNTARNLGILLRNIDLIYLPYATTSDQVKRFHWVEYTNIWNALPPDKLHSNPTTIKIQFNNYFYDSLNNTNE
jgi:hypothetical protein